MLYGRTSHRKGLECWAGDNGLTWVRNEELQEVLKQGEGFLLWVPRGSTIENGVGGGDRVEITGPVSRGARGSKGDGHTGRGGR